MDVAAALKPHLECPICTYVPRDGVMLQCLNGHNVCNSCKNKLGKSAKCPQGRCDFNSPPAKNFLAASIIGSFPFTWPCVYAEEVGCNFEGASKALSSHENECVWMKPVPKLRCSHGQCTELVSVGAVFEHFGTDHRLAEDVDVSRFNRGLSWLMSKTASVSRSDDFQWTEYPMSVTPPESAQDWVLCFHRRNGHAFVWACGLRLGNYSRTNRLVCKVTLKRESDDDYAVVFTAPIFKKELVGPKEDLPKEAHLNPTHFFEEVLKQKGLKWKNMEEGLSNFKAQLDVFYLL